VADGTECGTAGSLCTLGDCLPPITISTNVDLSKNAVTAGRACAESPSFAIAALMMQSAVLSVPPSGDCLVAGDEVMLISLQGTTGSSVNAGTWETLIVESVADQTISFTTPKTRFYGSGAGSDASVGTGPTQQKVALVRIPRFGQLAIATGATVTAQHWDGSSGGVLALRVATLQLDGTLSVADAGYRPGRWSQDTMCKVNVATEAGESISGPAVAQAVNNTGGSGGIAAAPGPTFVGATPISPSAGHAVAGQAGVNAAGRTLGSPGVAYGSSDGTLLTMGSGSSGNLTCDGAGSPNGALIPGGVRGAGIIAVFGGDITIGATGTIDASAITAPRDVAASGGFVLIRGANVTLGDRAVAARGGTANGAGGPTAGMHNVASDGMVHVDASGTVSGTTAPMFTTP
jgi:hypothetical protein